LQQGKEYEAIALVQIEEALVPDQLAGATAPQQESARRSVQLIEQRLMARDNLLRIMDEHGLFLGASSETANERIYRMRQSVFIEEIGTNPGSYAPGANVPSGLMIRVRLDDPQKAADLANELMYSVIEQSRTRSQGRAQATFEFFVAEEARLGREIAGLDTAIADFKTQHADQLPEGVVQLRAQLVSLREAELSIDQQIVAMETSSERQRAEVKQRQIALLREQKSLIAARVVQIQDMITGSPEVERQLNGLERQLGQLQEQYTVITRRKAEAQLGQLLEDRQDSDRFEVLETALVPEFPISRSRKKLALLGAIVSGMAALCVGVLAEILNPAIRSAAQMERVLGVRPVVAIPPLQEPKPARGKRAAALGLAVGAAVLTSIARAPVLGPWFDRLNGGA
jgi:uncharacterized protein involved in exopolysaccharide biosynthesis